MCGHIGYLVVVVIVVVAVARLIYVFVIFVIRALCHLLFVMSYGAQCEEQTQSDSAGKRGAIVNQL